MGNEMKEAGVLYCSGEIAGERPDDDILRKPKTDAQSILGCRQHLRKPHWHIVYEKDDGHVFIDWGHYEVACGEGDIHQRRVLGDGQSEGQGEEEKTNWK
jgi:hypothetical protein